MRRNEFKIVAEFFLNLINQTAFNACDVGEQCALVKVLLIVFDPLNKHFGVECEDGKIGFPNRFGRVFGVALVDDAVLQGIVDGFFSNIDGNNMEAKLL